MNLKAYLSILWGYKWVIITTLCVTVAVTTLLTFLTTPIYSASTTLRVATASLGSVNTSDYYYADRLMNTYTNIVTSRPILDELATTLNLETIPEVKVSPIGSTELFKVIVESPSPVLARDAANTLAEIVIAQSREFYSGGGKSTQEILREQLEQTQAELITLRDEYQALLDRSPNDTEKISAAAEAVTLKENTYASLSDQYEQARLKESLRANIISVVEPAIEPTSPTKPKKVINIGLGIVVGLVGGVGLVFLLDNLETRLYTVEQIEVTTEQATIGKIPKFNNKGLALTQNKNLKIRYRMFKESFHRLQTMITTQGSENPTGKPIKTILLTSAVPNEGKSIIVTNLAIAFSQAGKKTLVIDADMRLPSQHKNISLENKFGLSEVLKQQVQPDDVIQKTHYSNLFLLSSGGTVSNPTELLGGPLLKTVVDGLASQYEIILLDAPALLPVADGTLIAGVTDGVILVIRRAFSKEASVREACRQLGVINAHVIGVVINEAEPNGTYYYHHDQN